MPSARACESLRLYLRYAGISARAQMQYRASFVLLTCSNFLGNSAEFFAVWALFARFGNLRGWTLADAALFFGITNCAFAIAEGAGRGFDIFPRMVKSGDFDRLLLRPRSTAFQVAVQEIHLMRGGPLLQGVIVLGWAVLHLSIRWTPARAILLLASIAGGACMFVGLFVAQATLAFWTIETLEVMNIVTYGGTETAQYPMTIYRTWFRWFFTFVVPLAFMNYIPMNALLHRPELARIPPFASWCAPVVGVLFLGLMFRLWEFGVRHYRSTGS